MADAASALREAAARLEGVSATARLDAELLMAHAAGIERPELLLRLRDMAAPEGFAALVERRAAHEPVAYIVGYRDFWNVRIKVASGVLIPRADSETLIEAAAPRRSAIGDRSRSSTSAAGRARCSSPRSTSGRARPASGSSGRRSRGRWPGRMPKRSAWRTAPRFARATGPHRAGSRRSTRGSTSSCATRHTSRPRRS